MNPRNIFIVNWWYTLIGQDRRRAGRVLLITVILALVGAALGAWQAARRPPLYQTEVVLAVYPAHYRFQVEPHIVSLQRPRNDARQMAMVMAKGPNVLNEVIQRMGDRLPPEWRTPKDLAKHLVTRGGQGVYLYLVVNTEDPDLGYDLATTWAKVVEEEVETTFYRYDTDIPAFTSELQDVEGKLREAEAALEQFRRETGIGLVDESRVAIIVRDREGLAPGLGGFSARTMELGDVNAKLAEYRHAQTVLRYLAAEVRKAGQSGRSLDAVPLELITTLRPVQTRGRLTLEGLLALGKDYDAIATALEEEADNLQAAVDFLAAESDRLQGNLSADITRLRELLRQREAVEGLYNALLTKQEELKAEAAMSSNYVDVVEVRTPKASGTLSLPLHIFAGAVLGAFLGFTLGTTWHYVTRRREQVPARA